MSYIGSKPADKALTGADIEDGTVQIADLAATGTKDATTFLRGDGTFASAGGANTPAFMAYSNTTQSVSNATNTELTLYGTEIFDSDNKFNTSTGRFTPTVAGKYFVTASIYVSATATGQNIFWISKNGNNADNSDSVGHMHYQEEATFRVNGILDLDTDDYVSVYFYQSSGGSKTVGEGGLRGGSFFGGYKLIT